MEIPFTPVELDVPGTPLADPAARIRELALAPEGPNHPAPIAPGARVAVAVGSRAISGIGGLVAALVSGLAERGARPFIVPAMGSHGGEGAGAERATLARLGVTEERVGAEIRSGGEVVLAGKTFSGLEVWADAEAWGADYLVPVNRVKPHTAFRGILESGPAKMLAVGLGKAKSAALLHRVGLARAIPEALAFHLESGKVPFGIGLLENGRGEIVEVHRLEPPGWPVAEAALLHRARELAMRFPWEELDLLVVERMGKEVSGTGMDLHVIGLDRRFPGAGASPRIGKIVVLDLTPGSDGNANGVGYADVVTKRLADRTDWEKTRFNAMTAGFPEGARKPLVVPDEAAALKAAINGLPEAFRNPAKIRAVRIPDTARLEKIEVSPALLAALPPGVHSPRG